MLLANLMLASWHWNEYRILINQPVVAEEHGVLMQDKIWEIIGLILFLFTSTYRIIYNQYYGVFWFCISILIGFVGFLVAVRTNKLFSPNK
jgi:hypothetical protein